MPLTEISTFLFEVDKVWVKIKIYTGVNWFLIIYRPWFLIIYRSWFLIIYRPWFLIIYRPWFLIIYRPWFLIIYRPWFLIIYRPWFLIIYRPWFLIIYRPIARFLRGCWWFDELVMWHDLAVVVKIHKRTAQSSMF